MSLCNKCYVSHVTQVPKEDISEDIQSFRLQNLQPFTLYEAKVSCKNARQGYGYWSEWSDGAASRTPEDSKFTPFNTLVFHQSVSQLLRYANAIFFTVLRHKSNILLEEFLSLSYSVSTLLASVLMRGETLQYITQSL